MVRRKLGQTGLEVSPIGYGAFKIGRNVGTKYRDEYALPSEQQVEKLLNGVLELGINLIDTAPAYELSEERIGRAVGHRRSEFVLSTKVGETFDGERSQFDYSREAIEQSVNRSLGRLRTDRLDLVFVHSNGDDLGILTQTDIVETLQRLRSSGAIQAIGFSGKTVEGARAALSWADCLMVEYHLDDRSHGWVIQEAAAAGVGVVVKKALASGRLPTDAALQFVLDTTGISAAVVGSLKLEHLQQCMSAAKVGIDA